MTIQLCVADDCKHHLADCERGDECPCPPWQTAPGSQVCGHHADTTREHLREFPELFAILGSKPSGGGQAGGSDEPPQPISDRARLERQGIRITLVTWCKILEEDRSSPLPDERVIIANTRRDVVRHQSDHDVAIAAYRRIFPDDNASRHLQAARDARHRAELALEARETGADVIEALREHIDRHLAWLLNTDHAARLVYDVATVHTGARRVAYPSRAAIRILCGCGERVPISTEHQAIIRCPGCGEWGTLSWWRAREAPAGVGDKPLKLRDLPQWLFDVHGLVVSYAQLRNWTRSERPGQRITPVNPGDTTQLFDPEAVALIAKARLGRRTA